MELYTRETIVASLPVLELVGEVDLATLPELHQSATRFIETHLGAVVAFDLDGLGAMADAGLGVLLGAGARARAHRGDAVLVCSGRLRDRLAISRLDRALDVYPTAVEAAQAQSGPSPRRGDAST